MAAPKYRPLDAQRNELRVLRIHPRGSRLSRVFGRDIVTCSMGYVSLDSFTPEYQEFLNLDGRDKSWNDRNLLWDYVLAPEEERHVLRLMVSSWSINPGPNADNPARSSLARLLSQHVDRQVYQDRQRYCRATSRWTWGELIAMSYPWGDPDATATISVDGLEVRVTKNLESALRTLRDIQLPALPTLHDGDTRFHYVWADALCINQLDMAERNEQVKRMKDLYAIASSVFIWLGKDLRHGKQFVQAISMHISHNLPGGEVGLFGKLALQRLMKKTSRDWVELVGRPYWQRLWIIQELLLAHSGSKVFFGKRVVPLQVLYAAAQVFLQFSITDGLKPFVAGSDALTVGQIGNRQELIILLDRSKFTDDTNARPELMLLLRVARDSEQQNPRDKVYALLGLLDPAIVALIRPDYEASLMHVYREFVMAVIRVTGKLDIIHHGACSSEGRNEEFPTWIPDFSRAIPDDLIYYDPKLAFRASGSSRHTVLGGSDDGRYLRCRGILVDEIVGGGCSKCLCGPHDDHDAFDAPPRQRTSKYRNAEEAIWDTLTYERIRHVPNRVSIFLRQIPMFDESATERLLPESFVIDDFFNCNSMLHVGGKPLFMHFTRLGLPPLRPPDDPALKVLLGQVLLGCRQRRLFTTRSGFVGMGPRRLEAGDMVYILEGCSMPVLMRRGEEGRLRLVGECHVSGMMKGELVAERSSGWDSIELA